ncbi:putative RNA helicase [Helianthus anomalus]
MKKIKRKSLGMDEDDENSLTNFRISDALKNALKTKGIESLFPIQARTFESIYNGLDLIGKAKTGQVNFACYTRDIFMLF